LAENPLKQYSKRPGTFVSLPSDGKFYTVPPEMSADGEIEIRPMTASDEIKLKNPDGLMNSESLFQVIEHIAPGIANAKDIPTPDLDIIVIGMRLATYGQFMDVNVTCKNCSHTENYQINLSNVLASAGKITAPDKVNVGGLVVSIRPHTTESNTMYSNYQVELLRAARMVETNVMENKEPLNKQLAEIMAKGSQILYEIAMNHVTSVMMPDGNSITDKSLIKEWLADLAAPDYQLVRDAVNALSKEQIDRNVSFHCTQCETENKVEVSFDPANFFGASSL